MTHQEKSPGTLIPKSLKIDQCSVLYNNSPTHDLCSIDSNIRNPNSYIELEIGDIGTIGHVAHGKSTVVKAISGVQTVRFKNELERNITIKLGYASAKIYKCEDDWCPRPMCYRAYGSGKEDSPQCEVPGFESSKMKLMRHVSFVDFPVLTGHADNAEFALIMCPTEPYVLSGGKDKFVVLWSIHDHISTLSGEHGSAGSIVKTTDNASLGPRGIFQGHTDTVEDVQFCPTSTQEFCSAGDDSCLILWDARVGTNPITKVEKAHNADVHCVDWNPHDENYILTGYYAIFMRKTLLIPMLISLVSSRLFNLYLFHVLELFNYEKNSPESKKEFTSNFICLKKSYL